MSAFPTQPGWYFVEDSYGGGVVHIDFVAADDPAKPDYLAVVWPEEGDFWMTSADDYAKDPKARFASAGSWPWPSP
jgi:hypothetical protein